MKNENRRVEILAPAGSMEGLRAAVGAGADAVYMGGVRFGARAYADNPEKDALCEAIDYVHLHGKRIYLTVNTLLKAEEMGDELYRYLKPYYEQGVDAVIVQDAGVLKFISDEFPGLPIHASTQMSLTMAEGARCFEGYPVTRIVNARELALSEIGRIRENSTLEIESFVHGALCYCYSGQCLMSSMIGGRSGNRGRCAQPCRLMYNGGYLLSPKDICTLDQIPELLGAGIDSFKIEGRMKRYEYAAGVTAAYRREVDRYYELGKKAYRDFHQKHPEVLAQAFTDLQDLYNRGGFSGGYYNRHNGRQMMSLQRPNHSGVAVAVVEEVRASRALLRCTKELHAQDILEIRMEGNAGRVCGGKETFPQGFGSGVGKTGKDRKGKTEEKPVRDGEEARAAYEFTLGQPHAAGECFWANFTPGFPVKKGNMVYRTKNNRLLEQISEEYYKKEPKIAVFGEFTAVEGEAAELFVGFSRAGKEQDNKRAHISEISGESFAKGVYVRLRGGTVQHAEKHPMREERLRAALEKTGDTPFYFSELVIRISGDIFIPVSALNELRREALLKLADAAAGSRRKLPKPKMADPVPTSRGGTAACAGNGGFGQECRPAKANGAALPEEGGGRREPDIHVTVMEKEQFLAALKVEKVSRIYYDTAALPMEDVTAAAARAKRAGKEFFLRLPRVCRAETYDYLKEHGEILKSALVGGYLLQNYEELYLFAVEWRAQDMGKILVADAMLYAMNQQAKQFFFGLGVAEFTAPYEENEKELRGILDPDTAVIVYGRLPLMTSAQCVHKNTGGCLKEKRRDAFAACLMDRKGKELLLHPFCRFCYNVIYSAECLALLGCGELDELAPAALRYDFTFESGEEILGILEQDRLPEGCEPTRGHFRRGVL